MTIDDLENKVESLEKKIAEKREQGISLFKEYLYPLINSELKQKRYSFLISGLEEDIENQRTLSDSAKSEYLTEFVKTKYPYKGEDGNFYQLFLIYKLFRFPSDVMQEKSFELTVGKTTIYFSSEYDTNLGWEVPGVRIPKTLKIVYSRKEVFLCEHQETIQNSMRLFERHYIKVYKSGEWETAIQSILEDSQKSCEALRIDYVAKLAEFNELVNNNIKICLERETTAKYRSEIAELKVIGENFGL